MTPTPRDDPARMIDRDNPDAPPIVAMRDIRKVYNPGTSTEVEVLHGIDLQIRAREFVALIGPSGSGKSTLLNLLGLLERPTSGEYRLDGEPLAALDDAALTARRNARIGFVFQFHHLLPAFTALENVTLPLLIRDGHVDAAARAQGAQLLMRWAWPVPMTASRGSCPVACSSGSLSPGRWPAIRPSCWPTSRPAIWTRARPTRSSR